MRSNILIFLIGYCLFMPNLIAEDQFQEFKVKRKNIFEFTKKPELKIEKDTTIISFTVKDFCDVTVAIENAEGKILRHLASGVLGEKAPSPFQKSSLEQTIFWDNKDDSGKYVDGLESITIRVSLGLRAEYEKDLYYSPYKRIGELPVICAAPEGIYIYEGLGRDHVRVYNHEGKYEKTIYPFPASQLKNINGIKWWKTFDGREVPEKSSVYHQTLLNSGTSAAEWNSNSRFGLASSSISVNGNKIALTLEFLNRLSADGKNDDLEIRGPETGVKLPRRDYFPEIVGPSSTAFSPDGKILYMTGYSWQSSHNGSGANSIMAVLKLNYEKNDPYSVFKGEKDVYGSDDNHFSVPTSVDVDKAGNVYVSDYFNNRVQIFDSSSKLLSSIFVKNPAKVAVNKKTGEIYVFSWAPIGIPLELQKKMDLTPIKTPQKITIFSAFPELKLKQEDPFFFGEPFRDGKVFHIALDSWTELPTFWVTEKLPSIVDVMGIRTGRNDTEKELFTIWESCAKKVQLKDGKWEVILKISDLAKKDLIRIRPTAHNIQQLYFNPKSEKLYVGEPDSAPTKKAWMELLEIDPESNKTRLVKLPINPQDMDFDINGLLYMRTTNVIARFDMTSWKEVPFDYGSERQKVGQDGGMGGVSSSVVSGLMLPSRSVVCYHQGGMNINVNGDIVVACGNKPQGKSVVGEPVDETAQYQVSGFPGRIESSTSLCIHIWDKYGKIKSEDVVKGTPQTDGIAIDRDNNVYMLATPSRLINGKPIDDGMSSTLIKFSKENKGKFIYSGESPIVLPVAERPKRPQELKKMWVENYEWMYGGCGFGGFNADKAGGGCACWFVRFKLDYFARSFVPEPMQFDIAVLDSAGNVILKIGQYGNEDSKGKNSKEPLGGDEVGLFHPCFVAVQSDRRLFISDIGNEKILSVKLKYEVNEIIPLKK